MIRMKPIGRMWKKCSQYQTIKNGKKGCKACNKKLRLNEFEVNKSLYSGYASTCKVCITGAYLYRHRVLKQEFVNAYGGKCTCCGEEKLEFLTLEHIFNDGPADRKQLKLDGDVGNRKAVGSVIYKILKKKGWPKDRYTVLCWNCNCARKWGRPCPHEKVKYQAFIKNVERRQKLVMVSKQ